MVNGVLRAIAPRSPNEILEFAASDAGLRLNHNGGGSRGERRKSHVEARNAVPADAAYENLGFERSADHLHSDRRVEVLRCVICNLDSWSHAAGRRANS